ncbi:uncharacterized protein PG986_006705 [Apiospora aurea]|uniref:Nudix hydrolase domain-containing protein n=1 Tax=Apiospora aurea TaxID=335848 RepID=A0ABR1QAH7_9PEZI
MADQGATVPTPVATNTQSPPASTATDAHFPTEREKANVKEEKNSTEHQSSAEKNTTVLATALTIHPSLTPYHQTTPAAYKLQLQPNIAHLVVGAVVIRALNDTYSGIWELPGGSCDDTADPTPLAALTRELREETGLAARAARRLVHVQRVGRNGRLTIVTFLMDVEPPPPSEPLSSWNSLVKLDPEEHRDFVWATEHEVRQDLAHGGRKLEWRPQGKEVVLKGFRMAAEAAGQENSHAYENQTEEQPKKRPPEQNSGQPIIAGVADEGKDSRAVTGH